MMNIIQEDVIAYLWLLSGLVGDLDYTDNYAHASFLSCLRATLIFLLLALPGGLFAWPLGLGVVAFSFRMKSC